MPHTMFAAPVAALLRDVFWKSLPVFALAGLASLALRRASAAARHALWLLTLTALLCLPLFCALLPHWAAPVLPAAPRLAASAPRDLLPREQARVVAPPAAPVALTAPAPVVPDTAAPATTEATPPPAPAVTAPPVRPPAPRRAVTAAQWVCLTWLVGVLLVAGRTLVGLAAAGRLVRRCRLVTAGPLREAAEAARHLMGLTRPLSVRVGPVAVPMTCGVARPVVLLPEGATDWPADRLRSVLLHEAAHVQRFDWATMLLARCACALYWPHPLVWLAAHRLRVEAEGACDDLVLTHGGVPAPDYATHLLEIVRALSARGPASVATVAMASRPEVSARLRTILDAQQARSGITRRGLALGTLAVLALLAPLAALRLVAASRAEGTDAGHPVQTISSVVTIMSYGMTDRSGRRIPDQKHRTIFWMRANPPTISSINSTDPKQESLQSDHIGVEQRVSDSIRSLTSYPTADSSLSAPAMTGAVRSACTPWREATVSLQGKTSLLFTRDLRYTFGLKNGSYPESLVHDSRWFDSKSHRLTRSEQVITGTSLGRGRVVIVTDDIRYDQKPPSGIFDSSLLPGETVAYPLGSLHTAVGFRRYVSRPLPDGTRYTFLYPSYLRHISPGWLDQNNQFITVRIDGNGTQPVPWTPVLGGRVIASRSHGTGGTSWPAPHEEFISVVVGHPGNVSFPRGQQSIRTDTRWAGVNGNHHAFSVTDARTHLRFLVIHEDRYIPELFKQTDPVITGSFQILPPGAAVPSATADLTHEKAFADRQASVSNLKQIGLGLMEYAQDHHEHFPDAAHWMDEIIPYLVSPVSPQTTSAARQQQITAVFHDPAAPVGQTWSYAYNRALSGLPLSKVDAPAFTVAVFESTKGTRNASDGGQSVPKPGWHTDGSDYLFTDGHVKWLGPGAATALFSLVDPNKPVAIPVTGRVYDRKTLRPVTDSSVIFSHSSQTITPGSVWPWSFTHSTGRFQCALYPGKNYLMVLEGGRYVSISRQPMVYETSGGTARVTTMGPAAHQYIINLTMPSAYALAGESHPDKAAGLDVMAFVPLSRATLKPVTGAAPPALTSAPASPPPSASPAPQPAAQAKPDDRARFLAGLTAVQGLGVVVTLNDSRKPLPKSLRPLPPGMAPPSLIHDTDINQVVNELKAAGAEAIAVNDQRLVAVSPIRSAGPTILVNSTALAPPYVVRAIGAPDALQAAVTVPGGIADQIKAFDPSMLRVTPSPRLTLPAYHGNIPDRYARPVALVGVRTCPTAAGVLRQAALPTPGEPLLPLPQFPQLGDGYFVAHAPRLPLMQTGPHMMVVTPPAERRFSGLLVTTPQEFLSLGR